MRLALGSPLGLPAPGEVAAAVGDLGMEVREVTPVRRQVWGVARYTCADTEGRRLNLSVYGRDAADAQVLAKAWRALFYRDSGPTLAVTRVQQVEHEAYLTLLAARTGALVPEVLAAAPAGSSRDAVLATVPPEGLRLVDVEGASVSDGAVDDILANVVRLRRGGIAHGAISTETIVVGPSGSSGLVDFRRASAHAPQARLDQDMASALAAVATAVGVERTVASARRVLPSEVIASSLPHLQVAALDPVTSRAIRVKRSMLTDLRNQAASAVGIEPPELAEPRRVSWASLIFVLGTLIGGWALIGVLVNVSSSFDTIVGAQWGWVIGVFLLAQSVFVVSAVADVGSIAGPIVFSRAVALEFSNSFTALAAGTLGALTTRVRFFQKQGYPATLAVSSGALISTASWVVKGTLFLVALPFGLSAIDFSKHPSGGSSHLVWLVIVIVIAAGLIGGLVLAIPRLRRLARDKLRPRWDDVAANMRQLAGQPRKIVQIIGGCVGAQLLVALALGASLHAFGQHLSIATILIVLTLSSMVGGVSPTPGGMGVVEAGMIYLLTAAGISQNDAVAAVFVQRLFTAYLPPIWGWFTLAWMRRREYV